MNVKVKIISEGVIGKNIEILQVGVVSPEEGEVAHSNFFVDDNGLHYVDDDGVDTVLSTLVGVESVYLDQHILAKASSD